MPRAVLRDTPSRSVSIEVRIQHIAIQLSDCTPAVDPPSIPNIGKEADSHRVMVRDPVREICSLYESMWLVQVNSTRSGLHSNAFGLRPYPHPRLSSQSQTQSTACKRQAQLYAGQPSASARAKICAKYNQALMELHVQLIILRSFSRAGSRSTAQQWSALTAHPASLGCRNSWKYFRSRKRNWPIDDSTSEPVISKAANLF